MAVLFKTKPCLVSCLYFGGGGKCRALREIWRFSKGSREERTTRGETKPPLTDEVLQTTPAGPDRLGPTLPAKLDSVCPPGCFWLILDQY